MKGTAGVVVLYRPDEKELFKNIASYIPFLNQLFVIDNTDGEDHCIQEKVALIQGPVQYIANKKNEGVAAALNKAATLAGQHGYTWLLMMDQDSFFSEADIADYFYQFNSVFHDNPAIAIVAPSIKKTSVAHADRAAYSFVTSVITSGSLLRLEVWNNIGGFDEKLFIDEVDHEFCYRAYLKGYKIVHFDNIFLDHSLGTKKKAGYAGTLFKSSRTIHSPTRVYFMVRNYLYVRNKYKKLLPGIFKSRDAGLITALKNNLLFSGHFLYNLKSIYKAFVDYRKGDFTAKI